MTDEQRKAWEGLATITRAMMPITTVTVHKIEGVAILAADAVIKRCEDVEGIQKMLRGFMDDMDERGFADAEFARALRDYLLGRDDNGRLA